MNQEKFVSSYIELLNNTLTEAIQKNLVLQAQKKIIEDELQEKKNVDSEKINAINAKQKEIEELKNQINQERRISQNNANEVNELKKNVQHIDTFKNELLKSRQQLEKLTQELAEKNKIIDKLNLDLENILAKKEEKPVAKKLSLKKTAPIEVMQVPQVPEIVKDAGNF